jgi:hypothetical protein
MASLRSHATASPLTSTPSKPINDVGIPFGPLSVPTGEHWDGHPKAGGSRWGIEPVFVPKVCPTRAHSGAFWITRDYDDRMRTMFSVKTLHALARVMLQT